MKNYLYLSLIFLLSMNTELAGQVSAESDNNIQLNNVDTITNGKNIMIDRKGQLHLSLVEESSVPEYNSSLTLSSNYNDYGFGYEGAFYFKHNNRVRLGGLIRKVTGSNLISNGDIIGTLPKEYSPTNIIYPRATQNGNTVTLEIFPSGNIVVYQGGDSVHDYLSLEGISFYRDNQLGDFIEGGYLFYIANPFEDLDGDGDLDRGLIAAEVHTGFGTWGCELIDLNTDSTGVGYGYINSTVALDACDFQNEAVKVCDDLVLNGYDDWFLPSHDEMILIWENLVDWDNNGVNDGNSIGNFNTGDYWSSTEAGFITHYILSISLNSGYSNFAYPKTNSLNFRAVRVLD